MASLIPLSESTANYLAGQVAAFVEADVLPVERGAKVELAESFPIWFFPANAAFDARMFASVTATGAWHHQIHVDGKATSYARSRVLGPRDTDWELTGLVQSSTAAAIDDALSFVDKAAAEGEARLLAPAWQLVALWLRDAVASRDSFVIASLGKESPHQEVLSADQLREILRKTPLIEGRRKGSTSF